MYINCETKRGFMVTVLGPEFSGFMNITIQPPQGCKNGLEDKYVTREINLISLLASPSLARFF